MDARFARRGPLGLGILAALSATAAVDAAAYRTRNFVVQAATPALAQELGDAAERWRQELAIEWLGKPLADWREPCRVRANVHPRLGAGGWTQFVFDRGTVSDWNMEVQGSRQRVLDSVLPHEITHTVFASYFRCPLPRWADEGACTTVEHRSEIGKQEALLIEYLKTNKGIPFGQMFAMTEYPPDVLPLYAQGLSLTQFLLERRGKQEFLTFLGDGMRDGNWRRAVAARYGHASLYELQDEWLTWVRAGRPRLALEPDVAATLAAAGSPGGGRVGASLSANDPGPAATLAAAGPPKGARLAQANGAPPVYAVQRADTPAATDPKDPVRDAGRLTAPRLLR